MKLVARIALYLVLLMAAAFCFARFRAAYADNVSRAAAAAETNDLTSAVSPAETNAPAATTEAAPTNQVPDGTVTNEQPVIAEATNAPATGSSPTPAARPKQGTKNSTAFAYLGVFIVTMLAAGGLAAWDVAHLVGGRAGRSVMAEDYLERRDPEYDAAEEEWTKGNHLDAIGLMREYLKKNPNEQHVAIRISEIYEKDLKNFLAAALELEEVLEKRIPREKWGWTAIHLANLYSGRLNQPNKALGVLERIVRDYPDTAAAKKARDRLGIPEPTPEAVEPVEQEEEAEPAAEPSPTPETPPEPSNLPKGFRKKK